MGLGTNLQVVYDRFQSKVDESLEYKEGKIFNLLVSAISKSYKDIGSNLDYVLDEPEVSGEDVYSGSFIGNLNSDEIELLALWMLYEWNRSRQQKLLAQRTMIGTKDFNRLGNLKDRLISISYAMTQIMDEINALKNEFYTYRYG